MNSQAILGVGNSSWLSVWLAAIIPAYLIGFVLEHASLFTIEHLIYEKVILKNFKQVPQPWWIWIFKKWFGTRPVRNADVWGECNSGKNRLEQRIFKMLAEHAMFRSLILVFLAAAVVPSELFHSNRFVPLVFAVLSACVYLKLADLNSIFVNDHDFYCKMPLQQDSDR